MAKDCTYCGTTVTIPDNGALIIRAHSELSRRGVPADEGVHIIPYQNRENLQDILADLLSKGVKEEEWIHLSSGSMAQTFPITIEHLFARLCQPELESLIHQGDFEAHLQPILNMKDSSIFGYEALLRTKGRQVNPGELFDYAARSGLQSMLDQKARRAAVQAKAEHLQPGQHIFINFLPSTIYVPEFCLKHTFQIVEEFSIDPADLVFEVVETEKITDVRHLKGILDTYKSSGMRVALDDVGAGYSTIEMLSLLQPDIVKIDRSYINGCAGDPIKQQFLFEVLQRADKLGIDVLAEGIETVEEWNWLQSQGVGYGQGFYIDKPRPVPSKELILP
ncbi:EAL domain-containing protein [Halobacillus sp. KGW1]|uniref:EAL domain-containing protein n=1 Tax=Halobacillus sp. KGW1 TaxID=1793726 RepID=UPI0007804E0A|nr:EAL domain-containing protein [Halobacillus sp. KGW1]